MGDLLSMTVLGLIVLGLVAGVLSGMLGIGSGALLIPALVLLFSFPQKSAQGTALAVMVVMALIGAIRYYQHPEIEIDLVKVAIITSGAVVGVFIGTHLAGKIPGNVLRKIFAVFLLVISVRMLLFQGKNKVVEKNGENLEQVEKK